MSLDSSYKQISRASIETAYAYFDTDPIVRCVFNIRMNSVLNTQILFKRKGHCLNEKSSKWHSDVYSDFCWRLMRNIWSLGFAAVSWLPDERCNGKPIVFDLRLVDVFFAPSPIEGIADFKICERPSFSGGSNHVIQSMMNSSNSSLSIQKEIPNVDFFHTHLPQPDGRLNSLCMLLAPDLVHESFKLQASMTAEKTRCNPPIVTEQEKIAYDSENLQSSYSMNLNESKSDLGDNRAQSRYEQNQSNNQGGIARLLNSIDPSRLQNITSQLQTMITSEGSSNPYENQVFLESQRKYVSQILPEAPADVLNWRGARIERVMSIFCVPRSFISNESSSASGGKVSGESGSGDAHIVFNEAQKQLKLQLVNWMTNMYDKINSVPHMNDYLNSKRQKTGYIDLESINLEEADEFSSITIELPNHPNDDYLIQLYLLGFLKNEALCQYVSVKHGIAMSSLNIVPKLDLKLANNIKEVADKKVKPVKRKAKK